MDKQFQELAADLLKAKAKEDLAKAARIELEEAIAERVDGLKLEGTTTLHEGKYKVTIKTALNRSLDYDKYLALNLEEHQQFVELKPTLNLALLKAAEIFAPNTVAACVTVKPAKTSVKVEIVK